MKLLAVIRACTGKSPVVKAVATVAAAAVVTATAAAWGLQFRLFNQNGQNPQWNTLESWAAADCVYTEAAFHDESAYHPTIYSVVDFSWNFGGTAGKLADAFEFWMPGDAGWVSTWHHLNPKVAVQTEGVITDTTADVAVVAKGAYEPPANPGDVVNVQTNGLSQKKKVVVRAVADSTIAVVGVSKPHLTHCFYMDNVPLGQGDSCVYSVKSEAWTEHVGGGRWEKVERLTFTNYTNRHMTCKFQGVSYFTLAPYTADVVEWRSAYKEAKPKLEVWDTFQVQIWGTLQDPEPQFVFGFQGGYHTY